MSSCLKMIPMRGSGGRGGGVGGPHLPGICKDKKLQYISMKRKMSFNFMKRFDPSLTKKKYGFAPDLEIKFQDIALHLIRSKNNHCSSICLIIHMGQVRYDISFTFCENLFQAISRT